MCISVVEGVRVTKKDIVRTISEEVGLTQQQTKEIVQKTFDAIIESLVRERRIELRNFGVFEVKPRAARKARNPRTGEQVEVPKKHVVTFKPGKYMEAKVRDLDEDQLGSDQPPSAANEQQTEASDQPNSLSSPADSPSGRWDTD
jgi:DNA-binding protein HU-beta/integration host factor subunit beta